MSTQSKNIRNRFKEIVGFDSSKDEIEHGANMIMFRFLEIIEKEMVVRGLTRKDLAKLLNTSPSYITQLFRGTKTINLFRLAELQKIFEIQFEISAQPNDNDISSLSTKINSSKNRSTSATASAKRRKSHAAS